MMNFKSVSGFTSILLGCLVLLGSMTVNAGPAPKIGAWTKKCFQQNSEAGVVERCNLIQEVVNDNGARIAGLAIGKMGAKSELIALLTLPLGVFLPAGVELQFDKAPPVKVQYLSCVASGCTAVVNVDKAMLEKFKKHFKAGVTVTAGDMSKKVTITFDLAGFTKGFPEIQ